MGVSREFRMGIPSGISESSASAIRPMSMNGMKLSAEGKEGGGEGGVMVTSGGIERAGIGPSAVVVPELMIKEFDEDGPASHSGLCPICAGFGPLAA